MCISVNLEAEFRSYEEWKTLQQEVTVATGKSGLRLRGLRPSKLKPPRHFGLVSKTGGCGCELVELGAGPSDALWRFLPEVYVQLPAAIGAIAKHATGAVRFAPHWQGMSPEKPKQKVLTMDEFTSLCEAGELPVDAVFTIE